MRLEPFGWSFAAFYSVAFKKYSNLGGDLVASGFGDTTYNGSYDFMGYNSNGPFWWNRATSRAVYLYSTSSYWIMSAQTSYSLAARAYSTAAFADVTDAWTPATGTSPGGTVVRALVFPAASNIYWKPYV